MSYARMVLLGIAFCASAMSQAQTRPPLVHSVELQIPVAPSPVTIAGKQILAYELHLTNLRSADVTLKQIEVRDTRRDTRLAHYAGAELAARLGRPGLRSGADNRVVGGGMRAVLYDWLAVDELPSRLQHIVELENGSTARADVDVLADKPVVLDPPLRGGPWVAIYDPAMIGGHRTAIYTLNGRARIPARFGIDWVRLDDKGLPARRERSHLANWHGYGVEVLAVANAVVADARDDIENAVSIEESRGAMPLENASGNYVILDLGGNRYAIYEHLLHGSIRVKTGDRVKSGDVIAQLGNTGSSSSGPHLHFHVADAGSTLEAEGRPYVFRSFELIGTYDTIDLATSGAAWNAMPPSKRNLEMPAPNVVVTWP